MSDRDALADLGKVRTYPLASREHKVRLESFAAAVDPGGSLAEFLDGLGDVLAVRSLRGLARGVVEARQAGSPVVWALGAHVVKVGLSPVLIRLIEGGWVTALVFNGATAIHDWEIAAVGATSEEVGPGLERGTFGMAEETGLELNAAAAEAREAGRGFGEVLGQRVLRARLPHREHSLLAVAASRGIPLTIHVAIGSDIVHQHPSADGAAIGAASFTDFRRLVHVVGGLSGGVWINCGSAVQLPEVFLKALSTARNLGQRVTDYVTANLDMIRHYRSDKNVLERPLAGAGRSFNLIGHHEINVPLLAAAIELEGGRRAR